VRTEINQGVRFGNDRAQIIATAKRGDNFQRGKVFRTTQKRLTHAAFCAGDDYLRHNFLPPGRGDAEFSKNIFICASASLR
jgi:hypothetical protein